MIADDVTADAVEHPLPGGNDTAGAEQLAQLAAGYGRPGDRLGHR